MRASALGPSRGLGAGATGPALARAAGLAALTGIGVLLGVALGLNPVPLPLVLVTGVGLVGVLALAVWRYEAAVGLGLLLMPFVRIEPAPVDAVFAIVIAFAAVTGQFDLRRVPFSMAGLAGLFIALNLLSVIDAVDMERALVFVSITVYLLFFAIWVTGYVDRGERAGQVVRLYVFGAVVSAALASVALFAAFPGSVYLISSDGMRATGLFKDSNVYGPFLVPAALFVVEEGLRPRLLRLGRPMALLCFAILTVGVVLSYSRAAWVNFAVGVLAMTVVMALRRGGSRPALALVVVLVTALSAVTATVLVTGSAEFLEQRARFQTYDSQRFGAQRSGIEFAERYPIGIGPGQFELLSPVSAHSTYVRALAEEGILGAAALLGLLLGTLVFALRNAVLGRTAYGIGSTALLAAWCGIMVNSAVVDTLHWRHLWVLAGLIWVAAMRPPPDQAPSTEAGLAAVR